MTQLVGNVTQEVVDLLGITSCTPGPILLGVTNISHMQAEHPDDFGAFFEMIPMIILAPTYVALHPNGESIEYIKVIEEVDGAILVTVRVSKNGNMFARSLYKITPDKLKLYLQSGTTKKVPD